MVEEKMKEEEKATKKKKRQGKWGAKIRPPHLNSAKLLSQLSQLPKKKSFSFFFFFLLLFIFFSLPLQKKSHHEKRRVILISKKKKKERKEKSWSGLRIKNLLSNSKFFANRKFSIQNFHSQVPNFNFQIQSQI